MKLATFCRNQEFLSDFLLQMQEKSLNYRDQGQERVVIIELFLNKLYFFFGGEHSFEKAENLSRNEEISIKLLRKTKTTDFFQ